MAYHFDREELYFTAEDSSGMKAVKRMNLGVSIFQNSFSITSLGTFLTL